MFDLQALTEVDFEKLSNGFSDKASIQLLEGLIVSNFPGMYDIAHTTLSNRIDSDKVRTILQSTLKSKYKLSLDDVRHFSEQEYDISTRCAALEAVGFIGGPTEFENLISVLNESDDRLSTAAINGMKWAASCSLALIFEYLEQDRITKSDNVARAISELSLYCRDIDERQSIGENKQEYIRGRLNSVEYRGRSGRVRYEVFAQGTYFYVASDNDNRDMCSYGKDRSGRTSNVEFSKNISYFSGTSYKGELNHGTSWATTYASVRLDNFEWSNWKVVSK